MSRQQQQNSALMADDEAVEQRAAELSRQAPIIKVKTLAVKIDGSLDSFAEQGAQAALWKPLPGKTLHMCVYFAYVLIFEIDTTFTGQHARIFGIDQVLSFYRYCVFICVVFVSC
jgi:hypothetical protein